MHWNRLNEGSMIKIGLFTWHEVDNAYGCLHYLCDKLAECYDVSMWTKVKNEHSKKSKNVAYYSFENLWYGRIKKIRRSLSKLKIILMAKSFDVIIINDLDFFWSGFIIKKICPQKIVIHYNTEIHGEDVRYPKRTCDFYEKHANYPDMIIECLKERADYRKRRFGIEKQIYVINNTIPLSVIKESLETKTDVEEYFEFKNRKLPVLIYAGGCMLNRNLGAVIDSSSKFEDRVNFMFLCYGTEQEYKMVKDRCDKHDNCYLFNAVDESTLLNILDRCDIGIQYYDTRFSINHYLASPSKFYEYLSMGLNVISSNNHGIDRIIKEYDLGVCFAPDEGFQLGLERLLKNGLRSKEEIKKVFNDYLCYEKDSKEALRAMYELIENTKAD